MKEWLEETHSQWFELLRHFLLRFFDSDLITAPEHTATALIGAFSLCLPWFPLLVQPLHAKYAYFSGLATPEPYRQAVRADELWLITLMMSAIGLLTAVKWQSLFPGLRDYQALGSLPLHPRRIFGAKLAALLLVVTALLITINALPTVGFPAVSASSWQIQPSLAARIGVHAIATATAAYFVFFAMVACQGVLLNLLRPRAFGRVTGYTQGALVALMLLLLVLSFSIQPQTASMLAKPELARWLPPVWFLGLYQAMLGDPDPMMQSLAHQARVALSIAISLALASYLVSYHCHRELLVESGTGAAKDRRWPGTVFDCLIPEPRQQAVITFVTKTLAQSSQHRMILMAYGGFGLAIVLSGIIGIRGAMAPDQVSSACFVYTHTTLLIFLLIGLRHLYSIPVELKANWTFQLTERDGRREWLEAVDRFALFSGAVLMLAVPFPIEVKLLGWRALAESVLLAAFGLLCYEWVFASWEKLPFTCSYLPGKTPMWMLALRLLGILTVLQGINALFLVSLFRSTVYLIILFLLLVLAVRMRAARIRSLGELTLKYEEVPEPAVRGLNLRR